MHDAATNLPSTTLKVLLNDYLIFKIQLSHFILTGFHKIEG